MRKILTQRNLNVILVIVVIIMCGLIYAAFARIDDLQKVQNANSKASLEALQKQAAINATNAEFRQVTVSVPDNTVYLPTIKLKIPLNEQSLDFYYQSRDVGGDKISTTYDLATRELVLAAGTNTSRLACYPVRFSFEPKPNPYNPNENPLSPVKLNDGRILQIYVASDKACQDYWNQTKTNPTAIGELFSKAQSY